MFISKRPNLAELRKEISKRPLTNVGAAGVLGALGGFLAARFQVWPLSWWQSLTEDQQAIWTGSLGTWAAAIATFSAVVVALYGPRLEVERMRKRSVIGQKVLLGQVAENLITTIYTLKCDVRRLESLTIVPQTYEMLQKLRMDIPSTLQDALRQMSLFRGETVSVLAELGTSVHRLNLRLAQGKWRFDSPRELSRSLNEYEQFVTDLMLDCETSFTAATRLNNHIQADKML